MDYIVRRRERKDCKDISHVVTLAWNETYQGIVPDDFLKNLYLNEDERTENTYNKFDDKNNHQFVVEVEGHVVGFVNVGTTEESEYENCGELRAIYVIQAYKGMGLGNALFDAGVNELKNMGFDKMVIGCLDGNKSNEFYKHKVGKLVKTRIFKKLNLPENVYYFEKI